MRTNINIQNRTTLINTHLLRSTLDRALFVKGILADSITISNTVNKTQIIIKGFARTERTARYRNIIQQRSYIRKKGKKNLINTLLSKLNKKDAKTSLVLIFKNINTEIDTRKVKIVYTTLKHFIPTLFKRGYNLFTDFAKLTTLFISRKVSLKAYLRILGLIFKNITKRQHARYIRFIKILFVTIIKNADQQIKGLKLIINGKIRGKQRANVAKIYHGSISETSKIANTVTETIHVFTIYGVFGLRLSVSTQKIHTNKSTIKRIRLHNKIAEKKQKHVYTKTN